MSEARNYGIKLILSLVNNYEDFGGKKQYVEWARSYKGQHLTSEDDFFTNDVVKGYYKDHIKVSIRETYIVSPVIRSSVPVKKFQKILLYTYSCPIYGPCDTSSSSVAGDIT